jgi:hypothetical protein
MLHIQPVTIFSLLNSLLTNFLNYFVFDLTLFREHGPLYDECPIL